MDDPPPYSASDPVVLISRIAEFIDHHDYPQLCLVSSMWRDVFQARIWAQPHRYFTTQNRSASGNFFPCSTSLDLLSSRISEVCSCILCSTNSSAGEYRSFVSVRHLRDSLHRCTKRLSLQVIVICARFENFGFVPGVSDLTCPYCESHLLPPWTKNIVVSWLSSFLNEYLTPISVLLP